MVHVYDDAELLRLAAAPPRDVAPVLRRAHWFIPLVVLVAVVPVLLAWARSSLEDEAACWALRALGVVRASRLTGWLEPQTGWSEYSLEWAPPLHTWLVAWLMTWAAPGALWPLYTVAAASIWVTLALFYRCTEEAGGTRWAVLSTMCLAMHPLLLRLVPVAGPEALSLALMMSTTWGLWGHWVGRAEVLSLRLLVAGLSWGLLLLAGGSVALAYLVVVGVWWLWCCAARGSDESARGWFGSPFRSAVFSWCVLIATGGSVGLWWLAMMLTEHGLPFFSAWLFGRYGPEPLALAPAHWAAWWNGAACLGGWWVIGVIAAWRLARSNGVSPEADLARWLLVWNVAAVLIRGGLSLTTKYDLASLRLWETFALLPMTWLAAYGLDRTLRREVSWRLVLLALSLLVGQITWWLTDRFSLGVVVGGAFAVGVWLSAPIVTGWRRASLVWGEMEIGRWVLAATLLTFVGQTVQAGQALQRRTPDAAWHRLRQRLQTVERVTLVSLIGSDHRDAPQLRFLLRSLWPEAAYSQAAGWDPRITELLVRERDQPRSRMVVVEWNRQDLRLQADVGSGWQVTPLLEPEPYLGRRLAAHLLAPAEH